MSKLKLTIVCAALLLALRVAQAPAAAISQDLPAGAGVELVRDKCLLCHEADLIVSQRLSKPGWVREVDKMIRWGADVSDAEKATMVDYLAAKFAPQPGGTTAGTEKPGISIFEAKCLLCHEADLTKQQRLSRAGWAREVDKMIRWGADVSDAEKGPLIDYLADKYKPR